jgi:MerR family transcriptional regulator, heat shock protein HspR
MDKSSLTHIVLQSYQPFSLSYSERETVTVCHLSMSTLRHLRAIGLVQGQETSGELRYSESEITQLRRIRRLQRDLGINLAGVEVILHLLDRLEAVHQELEEEKRSHKR